MISKCYTKCHTWIINWYNSRLYWILLHGVVDTFIIFLLEPILPDVFILLLFYIYWEKFSKWITLSGKLHLSKTSDINTNDNMNIYYPFQLRSSRNGCQFPLPEVVNRATNICLLDHSPKLLGSAAGTLLARGRRAVSGIVYPDDTLPFKERTRHKRCSLFYGWWLWFTSQLLLLIHV